MEERTYKVLLLLPILIPLLLFAFYPLFYSIYMSLHSFSLGMGREFIGLENYRQVLRDHVFWERVGRTLYFVIVCVVVEVVLGLLIALLLNREFRGENIIRGLTLMPVMVAPLAMSLMWNYMFHYEFGVINGILRALGIPAVAWLGSADTAIYTVMLFDIWKWTPFAIFVFLAALKGLPKDAFEASQVDGAGSFFTFRKLTLPMLKPILTIVALLRIIWLINLYDPLYGTTRGGMGTETLNFYIYRESFVYFDIGRGSTLAVITTYMAILIGIVLFKLLVRALNSDG